MQKSLRLDTLRGRFNTLETEIARLRDALDTAARVHVADVAALGEARVGIFAASVESDRGTGGAALASSRAEIRVGLADLRASEAALASSQREAKAGQAELLASEVALASSQAETKLGLADLVASAVALASSRAETKMGLAELLASEAALASSQAETKVGLADLLASAVALASSRSETKIGLADLLASEVALASSQAETKIGLADLLASAVALASSQAETREGQADLLATEAALATSQAQTKVGLADLMASAVALASSRAEAKVSLKDLLASAVALSLSRAEMQNATEALQDREAQITSITKNQELLRHVVEASPIALVLTGADGRIEMVNAKAEQMFRYDHAELPGQTLEILLPESFHCMHVELPTDFLSELSSRAMGADEELYGTRKDGSRFALEIGLNPIDLGGETMVLAGVTDITARREGERATHERQQVLERSNGELIRARLRAEQATRAKSRFLAGMSHELRTPLNGILGYAQLLDIEGGLTARQASRVDAMRSAGQHLLEMITNVLELSAVEAGHVVLQAAATDVRELALDCVNVVRPATKTKGLALSTDVADDVPRQFGVDATRLRQVLLNLLANAVKFTERGMVCLRLRMVSGAESGPRLRFEIVDSGRGVAGEHRDNLFQDFERLGANEDGAIEGAGLGLSISAHLVGLMGGRIEHANNPGGGSVFGFELAAAFAAAPAVVAPHITLPTAGTSARGRLRIMVVDDIAMNREIASAFLRAAGHEVTCADGGAEAVIQAAATDFDAVFMDLRMPEVDGFEATRRIHGISGTRGRVPMIALTAHAFAEQVGECRRAGMVGHVSKPFTQATILAALAQATAILQPAQQEATGAGAPSWAGLPVVDVDTFETTVAFLSPEKELDYLEGIVANIRTVTVALQAGDPADGAEGLADSVHALAGTVGMVGFVRLSEVGRRFERATRVGAPELPALTESLAAALDASMVEVSKRLHFARSALTALGGAAVELQHSAMNVS